MNLDSFNKIMDLAYLHIVTNHIPIVGIPFALIVLLFGFWRKSDEIKAFALLIFAGLGILTLGVYFLGQGGEDFVEDLAGISESAIEDHEQMGLISLISVGITAALSLIGLIFYRGLGVLKRREPVKLLNGEVDAKAGSNFPNWLTLAVLGLAMISTGILGYTGKLGGKIRHTEFYGGAAPSEANEIDQPDVEEQDDGGGKGRGRNRGDRN